MISHPWEDIEGYCPGKVGLVSGVDLVSRVCLVLLLYFTPDECDSRAEKKFPNGRTEITGSQEAKYLNHSLQVCLKPLQLTTFYFIS